MAAERLMSVLIGVSGSSDDSSSSPPPCIFNRDPLAPDIVLRPSDGDNPGSAVTKSIFFLSFFTSRAAAESNSAVGSSPSLPSS